MLSILRDLETDENLANALHALIADAAKPMLNEAAGWRLTLNHMDGPFFRETIQTRGASLKPEEEIGESQSQRDMSDNASAIFKEIKKMTVERRRALAETVCNRCAVVRVVVADRDSGFRVFRVLNTRGKAPNAHDIIKTELFERANFSPKEADTFAEQWSEHEATLGGNAFDDLLRQIRAIHERSPKGDLVSGFQKSVIGKGSPREFLLNLLPKYVEAYREITTGKVNLGKHSSAVADYLNRLRALEHRSWRAPAIKFLVEKRQSADEAPKFFQQLERYGYMIQLIIHDRDQRNRRYRKVLDSIGAGRSMFSRDPMAITPAEAKKMSDRLLGRFATFGQRRAMALRLNAALEGGHTLPPESDATVEHVLPRNIQDGSFWLTVWPDPHKRREQCDTLGNFVLLPHKVNQKADRFDFRAKKHIYFEEASGEEFALTRDLKDQDAWTSEVVRRRTVRLAEILMKDWGL